MECNKPIVLNLNGNNADNFETFEEEFSPSQLFNSRHIRSRIRPKEGLLKPSVVPHSVYENC